MQSDALKSLIRGNPGCRERYWDEASSNAVDPGCHRATKRRSDEARSPLRETIGADPAENHVSESCGRGGDCRSHLFGDGLISFPSVVSIVSIAGVWLGSISGVSGVCATLWTVLEFLESPYWATPSRVFPTSRTASDQAAAKHQPVSAIVCQRNLWTRANPAMTARWAWSLHVPPPVPDATIGSGESPGSPLCLINRPTDADLPGCRRVEPSTC